MAWTKRGFMAFLSCLATLVLVSQAATTPESAIDQTQLVGNKTLKSFHKPDCPLVKRLASKAKVEFADADAAAAEGYRPCSQCKPLGDSQPDKDADTPAPKPGPARKETPRKAGAASPKSSDAPPADSGRLRFSRDIAPILAANCMDCHRADPKRGEFNLSTFETLAQGSKSGPVIDAGNPDGSLLVELVATRKMPRGNNRKLSDDAIAKIKQWVKEGALLDPGVSPSETLDKIIPTPAQERAERLARLSPTDRDKKVADAAAERFKTAGAKETPPATHGRSFVLFSTLPEDRAKSLLKALEAQKPTILNLFGPQTPVLSGVEKISLYVFKDKNTYAEFVRSVEQREVETGTEAHARLGVESPYLAAIDPLHGAAEPAAPSRPRASKGKAADDDLDGPERSLAGLLVEQLGTGVITSTGACPRWLADGFGASLAQRAEPRSFYYTRLRRDVGALLQLGWNTKVTEALADQGRPELLRAIGFGLCEWLASAYPREFPYFIQGIASQGAAQLDQIITNCFGADANREQFLQLWADFVASNYPQSRRR